jgi:hypothetical protein
LNYFYPYRQELVPHLVVPDAKDWEKEFVDLQMKGTGQIYKNAYVIKVEDTPGPSYGSVTFIPSGQNLPLTTEASDILFIGPPGSLAAPQQQQPPHLMQTPQLIKPKLKLKAKPFPNGDTPYYDPYYTPYYPPRPPYQRYVQYYDPYSGNVYYMSYE